MSLPVKGGKESMLVVPSSFAHGRAGRTRTGSRECFRRTDRTLHSGLHALHLVGGLLLLWKPARSSLRSASNCVRQIRLSPEHFFGFTSDKRRPLSWMSRAVWINLRMLLISKMFCSPGTRSVGGSELTSRGAESSGLFSALCRVLGLIWCPDPSASALVVFFSLLRLFLLSFSVFFYSAPPHPSVKGHCVFLWTKLSGFITSPLFKVTWWVFYPHSL